MNLKIKSLLAIMLVLVALSCKKKSKIEPQPDNVPVPVAHGDVQGAAFQKTIGAEGGTIEMPNSNISINIPAGAVTTATNFTVQPVSKTLEGGTGQAYRLGPENVEFKQDIEISFKYTDGDIEGAAEDFLFLAYQDSKGYWHRAIKTILDKQNKVLKIKTKHFSDWVVERIFWMIPTPDPMQIRELSEDQTITFKVGYTDADVNTEDPNADIKLKPSSTIDPKNIEKWELTTANPSKLPQGTISSEKLPTNTYKAPSKIANGLDQEVVACHIINLVDKKYLERPGTSGKVVISKIITLTSNEFFTWTVDGQEFSAVQMNVLVGAGGSKVLIDGVSPGGAVTLNINAGKSGTYPQGGSAEQFVATLAHNNITYSGWYSECNGPMKYGSGNVTLGNVSSVAGGFVSGEFTATVYYMESSCNNRSKNVTGKFKVRRII